MKCINEEIIVTADNREEGGGWKWFLACGAICAVGYWSGPIALEVGVFTGGTLL